MNEVFKRMWMAWFLETVEECHIELLECLEERFDIEERLPDNDKFSMIFSIFGS